MELMGKKYSSEVIEIFLECSVNEALEKESNYSISERLPYKPDQYDFLDSFPTVEKLYGGECSREKVIGKEKQVHL